jgi:5'-deoxynucleotidase YfbR-like HD superfamily hydrolase
MKLITQKRPQGIDLANIGAGDIDPWDIAHALSKVQRFGGHAPGHYSVAEHSIRVARMVPDRYKLEALLHDATEAYLGDVVTPLKQHLPDYKRIESMAYRTIATLFGIPATTSDMVREADQWILRLELHELFGWEHPGEFLAGQLPERLNLDADRAFTFFLNLFNNLRRP